jgi:dipeptidase D
MTIGSGPREQRWVDEETGMTGAKQLDPSWLKGKILLNLDTEQDNELTIGCAGGADVTAKASYEYAAVASGHTAIKIMVKGLTGGHSGMEIHLGRGNANKIMNRLLFLAAEQFGLRLVRLEGGSLRNAIPRESVAICFVPAAQTVAFKEWFECFQGIIRHENLVTDPNLLITYESVEGVPLQAMPIELQKHLFAAIDGVLSGIHRMSPSIAGLVQTSNNLARVVVDESSISVMCLTRSSVDTERDALAASLRSVLGILGGEVIVSGEYPGWQPEPTSKIVTLMRDLYRSMFQDEPHVAACHAGLECGIIGSKYPGMEMISFGPNILGAHSPDERVQVSSVRKFYRYFTKVLSSL